MIRKTQAIPLHGVRYGESSLICYLYSQAYGRITVLVHGAYGRSRRGAKAILFQPLNALDLVYHQPNTSSMGRLREVALCESPATIPIDPRKRAMALFLGEVVYRTVREEEANPALYAYLVNAIQVLDAMEDGLANFHLLFLVHLSRHLGIYPHGVCTLQTPCFDIKGGVFRAHPPSHGHCFDPFSSALLSQLQQLQFEGLSTIGLNRSQRAAFLESMLRFYAFHLEGMRAIMSLPVLTQVFD